MSACLETLISICGSCVCTSSSLWS